MTKLYPTLLWSQHLLESANFKFVLSFSLLNFLIKRNVNCFRKFNFFDILPFLVISVFWDKKWYPWKKFKWQFLIIILANLKLTSTRSQGFSSYCPDWTNIKIGRGSGPIPAEDCWSTGNTFENWLYCKKILSSSVNCTFNTFYSQPNQLLRVINA